jgi:hemin uptake protein HemP
MNAIDVCQPHNNLAFSNNHLDRCTPAMSSDDGKKPETPRVVRRTNASAVRLWQLAELLGEAREVLIVHAGETYRLRLTANNKVILTK